MRMLGTSIYIQLSIHLLTKTVLRQHTANSMLDNASWELVHHLTSRSKGGATIITGMTEINLVRQLLTSEYSLLCVDYDNEITGINMRSKGWFMFTAKNFCYLSGHSTYSLTFSVYNIPLTLYILSVSHKRCLHAIYPSLD